MLSRFATTSAKDKEEKLRNINAANTLKADKKCAKAVRQYLLQNKKPTNFETFSNQELNNILADLYLDLRKVDGTLYKCTSLVNFRHGLNRFLKSSRNIDIIKGDEFLSANRSFQASLAELKRNGMGGVEHYAEIAETDLQKLYQSSRLDTNNPTGKYDFIF